jgi:heat shock protein 90kDa beta
MLVTHCRSRAMPPHSSLQALGDPRAMEYMRGRKILEINPEHEIVGGIRGLLGVADAGAAAAARDQARDLAELMYETALITSGFAVDSPKDFASKVFTLMKFALAGGPALMAAAEEESAAAAPGGEQGASSSPGEAGSGSGAAPASASPVVEAEVVDPNDPWKKK